MKNQLDRLQERSKVLREIPVFLLIIQKNSFRFLRAILRSQKRVIVFWVSLDFPTTARKRGTLPPCNDTTPRVGHILLSVPNTRLPTAGTIRGNLLSPNPHSVFRVPSISVSIYRYIYMQRHPSFFFCLTNTAA